MKRPFATLLALAALAALLTAPVAVAADYSLAGGHVRFSASDAWPMLMEKLDGPREFVALQVKDPANTTALARVTVTTEQVDGLPGFQKFFAAGAERAHKLPGYAATPAAAGNSSSLRYTASENHVANAYVESYAYRANVAIQVRCIRPVAAPADWRATFDAGCKAIVSAVETAP